MRRLRSQVLAEASQTIRIRWRPTIKAAAYKLATTNYKPLQSAKELLKCLSNRIIRIVTDIGGDSDSLCWLESNALAIQVAGSCDVTVTITVI